MLQVYEKKIETHTSRRENLAFINLRELFMLLPLNIFALQLKRRWLYTNKANAFTLRCRTRRFQDFTF